MPELRCTVQTCTHNVEQCCNLDCIEVGESSARQSADTCCKSFAENSGSSCCKNVCGKEKNIVSQVDCKAVECVYNQKYQCQAGKISVEGSDARKYNETACATFTVS